MQPYVDQPRVAHRKNFPRDDQHRSSRLHITYGVLSVLLGVGCIVAKAGGGKYGLLNMVCPGIWGGVISIVAGVVGIVSCANEKTITIVITAVLSVLSFLGSACFTIFSVLMCIVDRNLSKSSPVTGFIQNMVNLDLTATKSEIRLRLILDILSICVGICVMFIAFIQFIISVFSCTNGGTEDEEPMVFSDVSRPEPDELVSYPKQPLEKNQITQTPHYL